MTVSLTPQKESQKFLLLVTVNTDLQSVAFSSLAISPQFGFTANGESRIRTCNFVCMQQQLVATLFFSKIYAIPNPFMTIIENKGCDVRNNHELDRIRVI